MYFCRVSIILNAKSMKKDYVRCRPCGYVMEKGKLGEVCPACGLPASVFEPYREKVAENRKQILALDLHPIAIHMSQTFVGFIPLLILTIWLAPEFFPETLPRVLDFIIVLYPLSIIAALMSGFLDGIVRFKTLNTPLLIRKILAGAAVTMASFVMFAIHTPDYYSPLLFILSLFCLGNSVFLGLWGKKLLDVILPGALILRPGKKKKSTELKS